jgi:RimJ/RimL family protein N-acetyltransferase
MTSLAELWPPHQVRITCGDTELRPVRDEDLPGIVDLVNTGIHPADAMPFAQPWTDAEPQQRALNTLRYFWSLRGATSPERWELACAVRVSGVLVGVQSFHADNYPVTRTGETGSWLAQDHQGRGVGTLMRQMMCVFLFDHLGAAEIRSAAFTDNPRSLAVSTKVGYVPNGTRRAERRPGELAVSQDLLLRPAALVRPPAPVEVEGAAKLREFLGVDAA